MKSLEDIIDTIIIYGGIFVGIYLGLNTLEKMYPRLDTFLIGIGGFIVLILLSVRVLGYIYTNIRIVKNIKSKKNTKIKDYKKAKELNQSYKQSYKGKKKSTKKTSTRKRKSRK